MPEPPFCLRDAQEICLEPYVAAARRREAARQAAVRGEAERGRGVRWSGLADEPSRPPRTAEDVRADAEAALARARTFAESPRGRFLLAVRALDQLGYVAQAERARSAFARGFADPGRPTSPAEIGAALATLARVDRPEAREACLALAELLSGSLGLAAE